ncbi:hypothetical protein Tco_0029815, partial [Tanacetum coccineum]
MRQRRWIELLSDYEYFGSAAPTKWLRGLERYFEQRDDGEIYFFDRIWIPLVGGVRKLIMDEAHTSRYSVHPGADKITQDIGSPRADDHEYLELPWMPEEPYVEAALQAPPSLDYVPGLEEPEQAPPSPDYVP